MLPVLYRPAVFYLRVECDRILLIYRYKDYRYKYPGRSPAQIDTGSPGKARLAEFMEVPGEARLG